jgi:hypothetical protein
MNKMEKMNKERAMQTVEGIFNILMEIPVSGEKNINGMAGIFNALKDLGQWVSELEIKEGGGKANDGKGS